MLLDVCEKRQLFVVYLVYPKHTQPSLCFVDESKVPNFDFWPCGEMIDTNTTVRHYGSLTSWAMTVNYIIGTGVLSIPYAFSQTGLALSTLLLLGLSFLNYLSVLWQLETMSIMDYLYSRKREQEEQALLVQNEKSYQQRQENHNTITLRITDKTFEMLQLCGFFLPQPWSSRGYSFCIILYLGSTLWAYASIFGTTMGETVPFPGLTGGDVTCRYYDNNEPVSQPCLNAYRMFILLFALIVIPLSFLNLTEQKVFQMMMTFFRFFVFFLMIGWCIVFMWVEPYSSTDTSSSDSSPPYLPHITWFDWSRFPISFPTLLFAQAMHHSTPILTQPVSEKKKLDMIFFSVFLTTSFTYTILGITTYLYFGSDTLQSVNLNWSFDRQGPSLDWWEYVIRYTILLFPAVTALSCFPLKAVTLGNSVFIVLQNLLKNQQNQTNVSNSQRVVWYVSRSLVPLFVLILSIFIYDLALILQIAGSLAIFFVFFFPAFLQKFSITNLNSVLEQQREEEEGKEEGERRVVDIVSPYSGLHSHPYVVNMTIVFAAASFVVIWIDILFELY
eukprot:Lithocolla_globosa_v1_NODE_1306_length_2687_cov_13.421733.p1 type:complete len:558 gc:universal NODE_1306_length_2687_cov_13.421733:2387-714(-)